MAGDWVAELQRRHPPGWLPTPSVDDGWRAIVERAVAELLGAVEGDHGRIQVQQIKEKWGGLRIYWHSDHVPGDHSVHGRIDALEELAECVCELCGTCRDVELRNLRYLVQTLCCACHAKKMS